MTTEIGKETVQGISDGVGPAHGHVVVGTTAAPLATESVTDVKKGVLIVADPNNATTVYLGRKAVTADNNVDTGGIPLPPGASLFVPIEDLTALYVISGSAAQDVAWMAL